ncbi:chorismate mutase [Thorsellia kenyensis]|uniref:Bifunctional chorismate mutase/prephenate dehydratase n=1 Tax=Thorsellia kenyensis TaxID=1549888 RepID=A0ABV6CFG8_9GAMM
MNNPILIDIRDKITDIDEKILTLLSSRIELATEVAKIKLEIHKPIKDVAREDELLNRLVKLGKSYGLDESFVISLFKTIIAQSVQTQQKWINQQINSTESNTARVVFLGPKGSYSHVAAREFGRANLDKIIECYAHNFEEIFQTVEQGQGEYAIVPLENSSSGAINEVYDLLQNTHLFAVGEKIIPIDHCLMGITPISLDEITTVYSHPQPFQQCSKFLAQYPNWKVVYCESTASAMEKVSQLNSKGHVAIGSQAGGEMYGLSLIQKAPSNQGQNMTRFLILSRQKNEIPEHIPSKTTFLMATGQHAGALVEALVILKEHNIIMKKLESRPMKGNPWEEMFYIDVEGNSSSSHLQNALEALRKQTRFLKILGSYPTDNS